MTPDFDLRNLNVYLIGMMGAGKSTTGKLLAQTLGYQFFDTDELIVQATGASISKIFAEEGEAEFRRLETQVLRELSAYTRLVIATGGGIVLERINWSYLQQGLVLWLDAEVLTLLERLSGDRSRPLLQKPKPQKILEDLLSQRRSLYAQADLKIDVNGLDSTSAVVDAIMARIPQVLLPRPSAATDA